MSVELVSLTDERGEAIFFVDSRDACGTLVASEFFATEWAAREYLAMGGGGR